MPGPRVIPRADRFELLLPLRGMVALAIVLNHAARVDLGLNQGRVVLFFLISGFCIFDSAESCLARSRTTLSWIGRRILRIWPAYLLALAYLLAVVALRDDPRPALHLDQPISGWITSALLLDWTRIVPGPIAAASHNPHLIVPTHWTLGYEVQFYALAALALALSHFGRSLLPWLAAALGVVGLAVNLLSPCADHGLVIDYSAHIAIGAAVFYRGILHARASRARFLIDAALAATFALALVATRRLPAMPGALHFAPAELLVTTTAALLLIAIRRWDAPLARSLPMLPFRALGHISYSIFLVHIVNMPIARELAHMALPAHAPRWVFVAVFTAFHVALAVPFWLVCERPFARWPFARRVPAPGSEATPSAILPA